MNPTPRLTFGHYLTLIFVVAKLAGYFAVSWWIVFIPMYILMFFGLLQSFTEKK